MASIINVDQIRNAAGTSGLTLDASTGKASFPNGAVLPSGSVLKVSSTALSANNAYGSNTGEHLIMTITHTAAQSNSAFLISATVFFSAQASSEEAAHLVLKDNTTKILSGADSGSRIGAFASCDSGSNFNRCQILTNSGLYTSSTHAAGGTKTFNLYFYAPGSGSSYVINKSWGDSDANFYPRLESHFNVMEIAQ